MAIDWQITKTQRECAETKREMHEGEAYFCALKEEDELVLGA